MRLAAVAVFIIEIVLSHTPGVASGAQSQSLSRLTHLPEGLLRSFAHVALFLVLVLFAALGFGPWAFVFCAVWAVVDEWTRRWIPGRHCSFEDMVLNLVGVAAGIGLWVLVR